jgi:DNA-binding protein H-NS
MLGAIVMIGSDDLDTMIEARKKLSHEQKKRDPNDKERRVWSDQMVEEYNVYKAAVEALEKAKKVQEESTGLAMAKGNAKLPVEQQERLRNKALDDDEKWVAAAIRYVLALSAPSPESRL